jgi:hypothetical protein
MSLRLRKKTKERILVISLVALILITVLFLAGIKLSAIGGYEGAKLFIIGVEHNGKFYDNNVKPPESEEWSISDDSLLVDFDAKASGMQDLAVNIKSSATLMRNVFGNPECDSVSWQIKKDDKVIQVDAKIYYFEAGIEIKTKVDEEWIIKPILLKSTEKNNPVKDVGIIFLTKINYFDLKALTDNTQGNYSSFASVLGIEVYDISNPLESVPKEHYGSVTYNVNFHKGMMLAMYSDKSCQGASYSNPASSSFFATFKGSELRPSERLSDYAYFKLFLNEFGVDAKDGWTPPTILVKLRIHVLKVDEWILTQKKNIDEKPEPIIRPEISLISFLGLDKLALALGIPAIILLIIFIIFVAGVFLLLFVYIALRLGITRKHIREVTGK